MADDELATAAVSAMVSSVEVPAQGQATVPVIYADRLAITWRRINAG